MSNHHLLLPLAEKAAKGQVRFKAWNKCILSNHAPASPGADLSTWRGDPALLNLSMNPLCDISFKDDT